MGWGVISGEERMIPQGQSKEVKFEAGKPKRLRVLLAKGQEPYSFFQHAIENEKFENGQTTKMYRTGNCPKTKANPYAPCDVCEGQQLPRRLRHSAPVWDYETGEAKLLTGGEQIWEPLATYHKMGIDVSTIDIVVTKTGEGRNDTKYVVANMGPSEFTLPEGTELPDPVAEYRPHSMDEMKGLVETVGLNWAVVTVPPAVQFPKTLQEALTHVMPNTKYKGQTLETIWNTNKGMIEFLANSNRVSVEKGMAQCILVAMGGAQIEGVPNLALGGTPVAGSIPPTPPPTTPAPPTTPTTPPPSTPPVDTGRQGKINEINSLLQSKQAFMTGGYQKIMDVMKQATDPNQKVSINEFTDAELDKMLELCKNEQ